VGQFSVARLLRTYAFAIEVRWESIDFCPARTGDNQSLRQQDSEILSRTRIVRPA
jgi:hypothetical protein